MFLVDCRRHAKGKQEPEGDSQGKKDINFESYPNAIFLSSNKLKQCLILYRKIIIPITW
jgi:hypothetical protein